jgi:uncharacterized phage protein (TIGR02218 family)
MKSVYGVGGVPGVGDPAAMNALLNSRQFSMADLYTITLADGTVLRYTSAARDLAVLGNVFSSVGPLLTRGPTRIVIGLEVDTLEVNFLVNSGVLINGMPMAQFAAIGGFDGARLALWRIFMPVSSWGDVSAGYLIQFSGRTAELEPTRTKVRMNVHSDIELLNVMLPRNVYQAGCRHKLYNAGCTLSKAALTVSSAAASGSTQLVVNSALAQAAGYFDLGVITFTGGANTGLSRTVKSYTPGVHTLSFPLLSAPAVGDTFTTYPGDEKHLTACEDKFANRANFGGFPFIPAPETAY